MQPFQIEGFITDKRFSRYRKLAQSNVLFRELFCEISKPETLLKLQIASEQKKPALLGVLDILENEPFIKLFPYNKEGSFNRQAVGAAVRFLLEPLGWERDHMKKISGEHVIANGMVYKQTGNGLFELKIVVKLKLKEYFQRQGYPCVTIALSNCELSKWNPIEEDN